MVGRYVNPGNEAFRRIAGLNYVDKTNLISLMNERVGSEECLVCISRPRRFGKTYNVKMLTAYYDCSCNSHALFDNRQIAKMESYEKHLNQYNVIMLDITGFISEVKKENGVFLDVPKMIEKALWKDLTEMGLCREVATTSMISCCDAHRLKAADHLSSLLTSGML